VNRSSIRGVGDQADGGAATIAIRKEDVATMPENRAKKRPPQARDGLSVRG